MEDSGGRLKSQVVCGIKIKIKCQVTCGIKIKVKDGGQHEPTTSVLPRPHVTATTDSGLRGCRTR